MELQECVKMIEKEYRVKKYTPSHYIIITNYMYNAFDIVTLHLREYYGRIVITDCGGGELHSDLKESDIIHFCKKYKFEFDEGYVLKEFKSVQDIRDLIELIDKLC